MARRAVTSAICCPTLCWCVAFVTYVLSKESVISISGQKTSAQEESLLFQGHTWLGLSSGAALLDLHVSFSYDTTLLVSHLLTDLSGH